METHRIAVIPGDGIGVDVVEQGIKVLDAACKAHGASLAYTELPWGSDWYFRNGVMMPDDALTTLADFDAIYLGAVGHPDLQDHVTLNGLLLPIRRAFDQYVCLRPATLYPGTSSAPFRIRPGGHRHDRHTGKHRGRVRQRRGLSVPGVSRGGRHPDRGVHKAGL